MNEPDLFAWRRQAAAHRKLFAACVEQHGPAIDAELAPLDRQGLVDRLKAEGFASFTLSGTSVPTDQLMTPLGRAISDGTVRSLVYDVLLLKRTHDADPEPDTAAS